MPNQQANDGCCEQYECWQVVPLQMVLLHLQVQVLQKTVCLQLGKFEEELFYLKSSTLYYSHTRVAAMETGDIQTELVGLAGHGEAGVVGPQNSVPFPQPHSHAKCSTRRPGGQRYQKSASIPSMTALHLHSPSQWVRVGLPLRSRAAYSVSSFAIEVCPSCPTPIRWMLIQQSLSDVTQTTCSEAIEELRSGKCCSVTWLSARDSLTHDALGLLRHSSSRGMKDQQLVSEQVLGSPSAAHCSTSLAWLMEEETKKWADSTARPAAAVPPHAVKICPETLIACRRIRWSSAFLCIGEVLLRNVGRRNDQI
uniref:Uncharacterized protein n=1 Tax=Macrostomum lignano TaxID=282301 RepID=A0A1I8FBE5_9PLAT